MGRISPDYRGKALATAKRIIELAANADTVALFALSKGSDCREDDFQRELREYPATFVYVEGAEQHIWDDFFELGFAKDSVPAFDVTVPLFSLEEGRSDLVVRALFFERPHPTEPEFMDFEIRDILVP